MKPVNLKPGDCLPLVRFLGYCPDPLLLFDHLTKRGQVPGTLFLESADKTTVHGEKSIIVIKSAIQIQCRGMKVTVKALSQNGASLLPWLKEQLRDTYDVELTDGALLISFVRFTQGDDETRLKAASPVNILKILAEGMRPVAAEAELGPLVAGVFAYDLIDAFEELPLNQSDPLDWPDFEFYLPEQMIWINHQKKTATAIGHVFGGQNAQVCFHDTTSFITEIVAKLNNIAKATLESETPNHSELPLSSAATQINCDLTDEQYGQVVEKMKEHIKAGDVIQIVPSRTFNLECKDPLLAYRTLRALNPSPYMFYIHCAGGILFGASPETAVKVHGTPKKVEIRPIAGTRPRAIGSDGAIDHDLDNRLEIELKLDQKELAEHMMLLDLARNDVARVSQPGTRRIDRALIVERYSHVMHLVSYVSGILRDDLDALKAYVATLNMGTLVGAPKLKATKLLRGYEATRRGPYGGAVGYLTSEGALDSCIVIRSAVVKDNKAYVRAGAGVVYDSDPHAEANETRRKAQAVIKAIELANEMTDRGGQ